MIDKERSNTKDEAATDEDEGEPVGRPPAKTQSTLGRSAGKGATSSRPGPGTEPGSSRKRTSEGLPQLVTPVSQRHARLESSAGVSATPGGQL